VARWLDTYEQGGLTALLTIKPSPGRAPALNEAQLAQLKAALARPAGFGSYPEVQRWIAEALGVEMKDDAVYGLVHDKLGARLKVPRPSHPQKTSQP
jgi:transposase